MERVLFAWSGGKDSALALYTLLREGNWEVAGLLTTVTEGYQRISMHGVRLELLRRQAESLGLPLEIVWIPQQCGNEEYERRMREVLERHLAEGVRTAAFGDIHLQEVRAYRERNLARLGMGAVFPLWGKTPAELIRQFIALGFRAVITCVDTTMLGQEFAGREIDAQLAAELPAGVDPCAENGEFHSFVYAGPIFRRPIAFTRGEKILREGRFYYCDLLPA
ncbi:MAG: diphthine--ammonia ligase [Anaerolineae bacterium]